MTSIERTRPQAPKEFNPYRQDHGTRGETQGRKLKMATSRSFDSDPYFAGMQISAENKASQFKFNEAVSNGTVDYEVSKIDEMESEDDFNGDYLREEFEWHERDTSANVYTVPTIAEYEGRTNTEVRASMARAATLDTFENDDFGDYNDSHVRISNRPR